MEGRHQDQYRWTEASRITVPFDYLTEDVANKIYYFIRRSMASLEPDPKVCDLNHEIIEPL
jgi:hypothetical protein